MNEIKCPNCGKVFQVDEAGYAAIAAQVHTELFDAEVAERVKAVRLEMEARQRAAMAEEAGRHQQETARREQEIIHLRESAKAFETDNQLAGSRSCRKAISMKSAGWRRKSSGTGTLSSDSPPK